MDAPEPKILLGNWSSTPQCTAKRVRRRRGDLDEAALKYVSNRENPFAAGAAVPDLAGFYFEDVDTDTRGAGVYLHDCTAVGLTVGQKTCKGFPQITHNLQDWDTVEDEVLTFNRSLFVEGQAGSRYGGIVFCTSASYQPVVGTIYRVRARFSGIIRNKPRQRTITVNGEVVSPTTPIRVNLQGGWNSYEKGQFSLPKIVVQDRYLGFTPPATALLPGNATPPGAPPVKIISFNGMPLTLRWPNGWTLAGVSDEQIADKNMHAAVLTYEYVIKAIPGS